MKDLALLVADKNMDFALRGILARHKSLGIRAVDYEITIHVGRDGGVRTTGPETLALLRRRFHYGIIMLDWDGSGSGSDFANAVLLEQALDKRLSKLWGQTTKSIVIEPELDSWVWGSDNVMQAELGWTQSTKIREWLARQGYQFHENHKPIRPKEALEALMIQVSEPRSSALYERVTSKISLSRCVDPAFNRLKKTLQAWFPA